MTQPHRILAAVDLSAPSRHAAERAALLARQWQAPLSLLHIADLSALQRLQQIVSDTPDAVAADVVNSAGHRLDALRAGLQEDYGVAADGEVIEGPLLGTLLEQTRRIGAELLVCGARGEGFVRRLFLGTTALRLLSLVECPVLVVKQAPQSGYRRILVPVDFSPVSLRAIALARTIAPAAQITLLHAFEVPFEGRLRFARVDEDTLAHYRGASRKQATAAMRALCDEAGLPQENGIVRHGDPALCTLEHDSDADLVVIGKQGQGVMDKLLLGSVTRHVLSESQSDVLVLS